jgi:histone H3/H4
VGKVKKDIGKSHIALCVTVISTWLIRLLSSNCCTEKLRNRAQESETDADMSLILKGKFLKIIYTELRKATSGMSAPSRTLADRSNPSNRRMARRGGIKRISAGIYDETRQVMKDYITKVCRLWMSQTTYSNGAQVLRDICAMVDHAGRKTCTVSDVSWNAVPSGRIY